MYDKYTKSAISNENLYYANLKKDQRMKDYTEQMQREKIAMENLKNQMEKEKQYQIDRKNRIKMAQYEDYNNYIKQKYSTPPQYREKLNIKLGGEQRNIKKETYNEQMENLCINPTKEKYEYSNVINYSDMGRKYQKGNSHGYNIITGEVYSSNDNYKQNLPKYNNNINEDNNQKEINENYYNNISNQNQNIPKENTDNINDNKNKTISISREEYEEFLKYKEMKKQKQLELEMEKEKMEKEKCDNENYYKYEQYQKNNIPPQGIYENINDNRNMKNNFHYEEKNENEIPKRFDEIKEKENFIQQQKNYYDNYEKRIINQDNAYLQNNRNYEQIPPQYYNEEKNIEKEPYPYPPYLYPNQNINNYGYDQRNIREDENKYYQNNINERQEYENQNIENNNNEDYDEQIQFKENISFPENQQINKNNIQQREQSYPQNLNQDQIKEIERQKYLQFLQEQNEQKNYNNPPPQMEPKKEFLSYKEQIKRIQNEKNDDNINNKIQTKYNDQPLTEKEKKEIIKRDYAKFLDWQINEKNKKPKTPYYQKNFNPVLDDNNNYNKEPEMQERNYPVDPYMNNNNYNYMNNKNNF